MTRLALFLALCGLVAALQYRGVVFSGADSNGGNLPGILGSDFIFPDARTVQFYSSAGMNIFRIQVLWERLQPTLNATLDPTYTGYLDAAINLYNSNNATAWISIANGMRYGGVVVGDPSVPTSALADLWTKLARRYIKNPNVIFGIMNEPYSATTEAVFGANQAALNGVRSTGSKHLVVLCGNGYSGVSSWVQNWYGTSNAITGLTITDSANNFAFDMHQFLDVGFSASHDECDGTIDASSIADGTTQWLRVNGYKAFLGSIGIAPTPTCYNIGNQMLGYIYGNQDVWLGFTYWGAGWLQPFFDVTPSFASNGTAIPKPQWSNWLQGFTKATPPPGVLPVHPVFNSNFSTGSYLQFRGVSESGPEWGPYAWPGVEGSDWIFPTNASLRYFLNSDLNLVRLPFLWERIQPTQNASFNTYYAGKVDSWVQQITGAGKVVLLDCHNYFQYYGNLIGSSSVPIGSYVDLWTRLALKYKNNPLVYFGLMNEPHDVATETVLAAYQAVVNSVRKNGATNPIVPCGNGYSGAHSWTQNWYGTPNTLLSQLNDPLNNIIFDMHQYFDVDFSGTHSACIKNISWDGLLGPATQWLRSNGRRAIIGEWGLPVTQDCYDDAGTFLTYLNKNSDVWAGQVYWAAGGLWGRYFMGLEPLALRNGTLVSTDQWTDVVSKYATSNECVTVQQSVTYSWTQDGRTAYQFSVTLTNSAPVRVNPVTLSTSSSDAARILNYWNIVKNGPSSAPQWATPDWQNGIPARSSFTFGYIAFGLVNFLPSPGLKCGAAAAPPADTSACGGTLVAHQSVDSDWFQNGKYTAQYTVTITNRGSVTRPAAFTVSAADFALVSQYWNINNQANADGTHSLTTPGNQNVVAAGKTYTFGYIATDRQVLLNFDAAHTYC